MPGGRLEVAVRYQGVHVYSKSGSLCEAVACPVPEGRSTLVMQERMPHFAPPVSHVEGIYAYARALWCWPLQPPAASLVTPWSAMIMNLLPPCVCLQGAYTMRLEATHESASLFCIEIDFRIAFGRNPVAMLGSVFGKQ